MRSPEEILALLNPSERDLLAGRCNGWGGWMWEAGKYMVSLGLGTRCEGSIQFDTPLAAEVKALIGRDSDGR